MACISELLQELNSILWPYNCMSGDKLIPLAGPAEGITNQCKIRMTDVMSRNWLFALFTLGASSWVCSSAANIALTIFTQYDVYECFS